MRPRPRPALSFLLAALAALPVVAEARKPPSPDALIRAAVSFSPPKGWTARHHANGPDPVLEFVSGVDRIALRLFGTNGTAYATPAAFLRGPAAGTLGKPPRNAGERKVAGEKRALYEHRVFVPGGGAAGLRESDMALERFVVLPLPDGRFLVAAHAYLSPVPSAAPDGEKAFDALLATLKPARKP